jgi:hypothetical protein
VVAHGADAGVDRATDKRTLVVPALDAVEVLARHVIVTVMICEHVSTHVMQALQTFTVGLNGSPESE